MARLSRAAKCAASAQGGGAEWMFVPRWSTFLEYSYVDFGTSHGAFDSVRSDAKSFLVGVNFKF
jgi:opacity protein-like surface antigen